MKTRSFNQAGIGHIVLVAVLLLVGVIGFAGYQVVQKNAAKTEVAQTAPAETAPASIKSKADLEKTEKALAGSDAELDSSLNDKALDADIDSML